MADNDLRKALVVVAAVAALGGGGALTQARQHLPENLQHVLSSTPNATASSDAPAPAGAKSRVAHPNGRSGSALATLNTLPVKGKAPMTEYKNRREVLYGKAWTDDQNAPGGHNGCDTRNDILRRDLTNIVYKNRVHCAVASGTLNDPYTGKVIHFVRGKNSSDAVQIEHAVATGNNWATGGQQLSQAQRVAFANDPLNLAAVDGPTNEKKRDKDASGYLPSNKKLRCAYVATQIAVKAKYRLWVTPAEKAAMRQVLNTCPTQQLPTQPGGYN